jgi:integral membrane sensor domain MASE1
MQAWPNTLRRPVLSAALVVAYGASALFCLTLARNPSGLAALWPASGVLAAAFLVLPARWAMATAIGCGATQLSLNLLLGTDPILAALFPLLCISEAFTASWLARKTCGQSVRLTSLKRLGQLMFAIVPATGASSVLAADLLSVLGRNFDHVLVDWFYAHALGMAVVLPAALLILRGDSQRNFDVQVVERLGLFALTGVMTLLSFAPSRYPLMLLMFPTLGFVAFRLGPRGVAWATLLVSALSAGLVVWTPGSTINAAWTVATRIHNLQFFITVSFFTSLATALIIAEHKRMKRLWISRSRMARAAEARALKAGRAKTDFLANMSWSARTSPPPPGANSR